MGRQVSADCGPGGSRRPYARHKALVSVELAAAAQMQDYRVSSYASGWWTSRQHTAIAVKCLYQPVTVFQREVRLLRCREE